MRSYIANKLFKLAAWVAPDKKLSVKEFDTGLAAFDKDGQVVGVAKRKSGKKWMGVAFVKDKSGRPKGSKNRVKK